MYRFSSPALLKEYFYLVLEEDFAYGKNYKLKDKILAICTTLGLEEKNFEGVSIEDVLKPFELIAKLMKINYRVPFWAYVGAISNEDLEKKAKEYIDFLQKL